MLDTADIIAFAATTDSAKARAFYEGRLGLVCVSEDDFAVVFDAHGRELRLQKVDRLSPQPHTQLGWAVSSISAEVDDLGAKGVGFERFPFLNQDAQGVWSSPSGAKVAWFKDPDGNVLSLTQR